MPEEPSQDDLSALDDLLDEIQAEDPMDKTGNEPVPSTDELSPEDLGAGQPPQTREKPPEPPTPPEPKVVPKPSENIVNTEVDKMAGKLLGSALDTLGTTVDRFAEDRSEVQEVIDHLKHKIFHGEQQKGLGTLMESLVSALRVKTDATANLTRVGDMISKLLSAGKEHMSTQSSTDVDMKFIQDALEQPAYGDEKKRMEEGDVPEDSTG